VSIDRELRRITPYSSVCVKPLLLSHDPYFRHPPFLPLLTVLLDFHLFFLFPLMRRMYIGLVQLLLLPLSTHSIARIARIAREMDCRDGELFDPLRHPNCRSEAEMILTNKWEKLGNHQIAQWEKKPGGIRAKVYFTRSPNASLNIKLRLRQLA
jgi:hypothetical protein